MIVTVTEAWTAAMSSTRTIPSVSGARAPMKSSRQRIGRWARAGSVSAEETVLLLAQLVQEARRVHLNVVPGQRLVHRDRPLDEARVGESEREQVLGPCHRGLLRQAVDGVAAPAVEPVARPQVALGHGYQLGDHAALEVAGGAALDHGPRHGHGHLDAGQVVGPEEPQVGPPLLCGPAAPG